MSDEQNDRSNENLALFGTKSPPNFFPQTFGWVESETRKMQQQKRPADRAGDAFEQRATHEALSRIRAHLRAVLAAAPRPGLKDEFDPPGDVFIPRPRG
jgi:hypothetical protein